MEQNNYKFIKWSCEISPNVLDWIRSIYFSLLGSSMLTFWLKITVLSPLALMIFALGISAFWVALFVSISIANSFKKHEKNYDGTDNIKTVKKPERYYYEQEIDTKHPQRRNVVHFLLYFIWIPAFACIAYAGCYMEGKSTKSSFDTKDELHGVKKMVEKLHSSHQILIHITEENKQLHDSLRFVKSANNYQEKQIDSLKKFINTLTPKKKKVQKKD